MLLFIITCFLFIITCCCLSLHVYCCLGNLERQNGDSNDRQESSCQEPQRYCELIISCQLLVSSSCVWQRKAAGATQ